MRTLFLIICFYITIVFCGCTEEYSVYDTGIPSIYTDRILDIFPNPAMLETVVVFKVTNPGKIKLYIASVTGVEKMLLTDKEYRHGSHEIEVNLSGLNDGVYMVHFVNTEGLHSWAYLYKGKI